MARILIVDDESNIRFTVRLALQHVGYDVDTASDGLEALDKFGVGDNFDLVLLDQRMPGMEGLEVLRLMRLRDSRAKIIMATAFGTIDLAVEAMKLGAVDFIRKPFTAEVLRGSVQAALTAKAAEKAVVNSSAGFTFGSTTINGFRIEFESGSYQIDGSDFKQLFTIRSPDGSVTECTVLLPAYLMELVKAHTEREELPGGPRFWQGMCEEALANYLWQNADSPSDSVLCVEDLTTGLRRFVDAVLAA